MLHDGGLSLSCVLMDPLASLPEGTSGGDFDAVALFCVLPDSSITTSEESINLSEHSWPVLVHLLHFGLISSHYKRY